MSVVLVEDNVKLRNSLVDFLTVEGFEVEAVGSAVELYQLIAARKFDVAVVDINLPHHDGFSITRYLAQEQLCSVIITSIRDSIEDRVKGYRSGADIYMVKPVDPLELSAAIDRLSKKAAIAPLPGKAPVHHWSLDTDRRTLWAPNDKVVSLSNREVRLLQHLIEAGGEVVSRNELLGLMQEEDPALARGKLDTALSRLRQKVQKKAGIALPIVTLHNVGFSFSDGAF